MRLIRYRLILATTTAVLVALAGCASQGGGSAATDKPAAKQTAQSSKPAAKQTAQTAKPAAPTAKAADSPPKGTKLAKVALGMTDLDVRKAIGEPDSQKNYMTGKAWIPFYWGPDVARTDWMYKGQGRVVFSRNRYNGGLKVIRITYDPTQAGS